MTSPSEPHVSVRTEAGARRVRLDRAAKRNALSAGMREALRVAFASPPAAEERILILDADGPVFSAGNDLALVSQGMALGRDGLADLMLDDVLLIGAMVNCGLPTVALVDGPAIGFGTELVAACDWVIAASSARFTWPEPKLGIIPSGLAAAQLGRHFLWSALPSGLDAREAAAHGLVHDVTDKPRQRCEELLEFVRAMPAGAYRTWRSAVLSNRPRVPTAHQRLAGLWAWEPL